jgi:hypothetical protein
LGGLSLADRAPLTSGSSHFLNLWQELHYEGLNSNYPMASYLNFLPSKPEIDGRTQELPQQRLSGEMKLLSLRIS